MSDGYSTAVDTAREYYNSEDADNFYSMIWGGEDIHIGWYRSDDEPIRDASRRTVEQMANRLADTLTADSRVLDLGAGYGGAARYLVQRFGCHVTALNLSEAENDRNRTLNIADGLDDRIDVVDGSFEDIPYDDDSFDVVWSQDAILHSGNRPKVLAETARVLKSGGHFIFTDPMQADDCPEGVLEPILDRIHLETLGSPGFYRSEATSLGMEFVDFEDATEQLQRHYSRVLEETVARESEIADAISPEYIERMKAGLGHWIEGGRRGHLAWGIFHFRKP
ncbi:MAG: methyltransferase domain-containing protein [Gemmatimonadota bacterium]